MCFIAVPCADTVAEYPPSSKFSVPFDVFINATSVIPFGNSAWYKHDLPSADKSRFLSSRVPLLIAFPIFKVFSFGATPVTMVIFGLASLLHP